MRRGASAHSFELSGVAPPTKYSSHPDDRPRSQAVTSANEVGFDALDEPCPLADVGLGHEFQTSGMLADLKLLPRPRSQPFRNDAWDHDWNVGEIPVGSMTDPRVDRVSYEGKGIVVSSTGKCLRTVARRPPCRRSRRRRSPAGRSCQQPLPVREPSVAGSAIEASTGASAAAGRSVTPSRSLFRVRREPLRHFGADFLGRRREEPASTGGYTRGLRSSAGRGRRGRSEE